MMHYVALAEDIAGTDSESSFEMMNEKAEELGLQNTNFTKFIKINDPDNYSTVRDIAMHVKKYLIKNYPKYYEYFKKRYNWDRTGGDPIKKGNRNPLCIKLLVQMVLKLVI